MTYKLNSFEKTKTRFGQFGTLFCKLDFVPQKGCAEYSLLTQQLSQFHEVNPMIINGTDNLQHSSVLILDVKTPELNMSKALHLTTRVRVCNLKCDTTQIEEIFVCLAKDAATALEYFAPIDINMSSANILSKSSANTLGHLQLKASEIFGQILYTLCKTKYDAIRQSFENFKDHGVNVLYPSLHNRGVLAISAGEAGHLITCASLF